MEAKAGNIIEHSDEIMASLQGNGLPRAAEKNAKTLHAEKQQMIADKVGAGTHRMTRKASCAQAREDMAAGNEDGSDGGDSGETTTIPSAKSVITFKRKEEQM
jgi:hypothetical protein